jgi:protein-L-isoaspartate(D-aspartate) O-methyltransferase
MPTDLDAMVDRQIVRRGVRDPQVLEAMRRVPRAHFMPATSRSMATYDGPLAIGHGQTISQPYIVALMVELLELQAHHRVLEVGAGMGYQAAVLGSIAREVHSLEIVAPLADAARGNLAEQGFEGVSVHHRDGWAGLPEHAPFDAIITAAAPDELPTALTDQLAMGGRLVLPVGPRGGIQELVRVRKTASGLSREHILGVRFVPMVRGEGIFT